MNYPDAAETVPTIGHDIPWSDVVDMVLRVIDFDRNGTITTTSGKVKARTMTDPYGYLLVRTQLYDQPGVELTLPICHSDDFRLATSVFDSPELTHALAAGEIELLVVYKPQRTKADGRAASIHHFLHYALVPQGSLKRYYAKAIRILNPELELLFGKLKYYGEVGVNFNRDPEL